MEIEVLLKDGTFLKCVIYSNGESGEYPINDIVEIHGKFQKPFSPHSFNDDLIYFQTNYIHGCFHPNNVLYYGIKNEQEL